MVKKFSTKHLKVALVTDWMTSFGGEHRVLASLHKLFPEAPIYTTAYRPDESPGYENAHIIESYLTRFPFSLVAKKRVQMLLPFMPVAFESFDFSSYDLVISSSHACSKGIITKAETLHISYCHSPMRYAWENCHEYIRENAPLKALGGRYISERIIHTLRLWDRLAADRVDAFVANSHYIARQIKKFYKKDATVIYPPVETQRFSPGKRRGKYFLAGGRLIPNKKLDLVVLAFNELGLPLKIFGKGPERERLQAMAGPNIEFLGFMSEKDIASLYSHAQAFIVPQREDFGIVTVEAQAAGTPIIGFGRGGTQELVQENIQGVLFYEQTPHALVSAVRAFQNMTFDHEHIHTTAQQFDTTRFEKEMQKYIDYTYSDWKSHLPHPLT